MTPATPIEIAAGTNDVQGAAAATGLRLMGYSYRETSGAAVEIIFRNGTTDTAPAIAFVKGTASSSDSKWFGDAGIECPSGLFVDRISGQTHLVLYTWKNA